MGKCDQLVFQIGIISGTSAPSNYFADTVKAGDVEYRSKQGDGHGLVTRKDSTAWERVNLLNDRQQEALSYQLAKGFFKLAEWQTHRV